jgi:hypothetical protein
MAKPSDEARAAARETHRKMEGEIDVHQPSNSAARAGPTSKPCTGWPSTPAFGGYRP